MKKFNVGGSSYKGRCIFCQGTTVKYAFIKENVLAFNVAQQCSALEVSSNRYYQWLKAKPSNRAIANTELDKNSIDIFVKNKGRYGCMQITKELQSQGKMVGKNRVEKRMHSLEPWQSEKIKSHLSVNSVTRLN